jgi:pimeloyl-ACP methyl ester carboxylesterase
MRVRRSTSLAGVASVLAVSAASFAAESTFSLKPCTPEGVVGPAQCGTFEVFENRAAKSGRKIGLEVILLPATGPNAIATPWVYFAGGPGDSVVKDAAGMSRDPELRAWQPVLLVDVRGTGESNGLFCKSMMGEKQVQEFLDSFLPTDGVRACTEEWKGKADLSQYTTVNIVEDVEDLRRALGYDKFDLEGASGGTRVVLEYLRRHPEAVRTAFIEGVVPPDARLPSTFAQDSQAALDGVLGACERDAACRAAFPDPAGDLELVLERLRLKPATAVVPHAKTGEPLTIRIAPQGLAQVLRYALYLPSTSAQIPMLLRAAARGDFRPVAELAQFWGGAGVQLADGAFLSITCAEDLAFFDEAAGVAAARDTFLGDFRVRLQKAACREWNVGAIDRKQLEAVRSNVPTLVVSGQWDPVTPARWGEQVAATLPNSRHVVVPGSAHGHEGMNGAGECLLEIRKSFAATADATKLDTSCLAKITRPAWTMRWAGEDRVELPSAELEPLIGRFASEDGVFEIRRENGRLTFLFAGMPPFWLQPMKDDRFQIMGLPDGFMLHARRAADGSIEGFDFFPGAQESHVYRREAPGKP